MALLEVRDLRVRYGAIEAVREVSLSIEAGDIVALLGANGAGKSTTLRAITGMIRSAGSIVWDGAPIIGLPAHAIVLRGISHVPEGRGIFANLTVDENLDLGAYTRKGADQGSDRDKLFELFPRLKERLRQKAGTLSGGEQQMLAIARALLARPRLLLLDEPSLGMAPQMVEKIFNAIREINAQGTTILLVEQNAHMSLQVARYAYVLEVGKIVLEGPSAEIAAKDEIHKVYLGVK